MSSQYFSNKVAMVTGGNSGIGFAVCRELAKCGAIVIILDINANTATELIGALNKETSNVSFIRADISISGQVENAIIETVKKFGRIDFFFNVAGIAMVAEGRKMDIERWEKMIKINLMGVIYGTHYAYKIMCDQKSGHIVNVASLGGLVPAPLRSAYAAGKFGVVGLTLALRMESKKYNVKINLVCPGAVRTPIFQSAEIIVNDPEKIKKHLERTKMLSTEVAAKKILAGIIKDKNIITFDMTTKLIWRLFRFSPSLVEKIASRITVHE